MRIAVALGLFIVFGATDAPFAVECYRELGVPEAAEIVERSLEILQQERPILERFWNAGTIEAFSESYKHTSLNSLD